MNLWLLSSLALRFVELLFAQPSGSLNHIHHNIDSNSDYLQTSDTGSARNLPPNLSAPDLITRRGYPVEIHEILTGDGYILIAHRIPYGKTSPPGHGHKFPVYLLHGAIASSADWVQNFEEDNCLPFSLANNGYDVWLGNMRGNIYSNRHLNLSHDQTKFWDFSIDETTNYDVPATIDYILNTTKRDKLHFIGYSLGSTHIFMALANKPEYNLKIGILVAYAPVVFFGLFPDSNRLLAYFATPLRLLNDIIGGFPLPPQGISFLMAQILPKMCNPQVDLFGLCRQVIYLIFGFGSDQITREHTPNIVGHLNNPNCFKMIIHMLQMAMADRFCRYDHGFSKNMKIYGQASPPNYDLKLVTSPTSLYFGENDVFVNKTAMERLLQALPNVVDSYTVPNDKFAHLDFIYGSDANYLVYDHTLQRLNHFTDF